MEIKKIFIVGAGLMGTGLDVSMNAALNIYNETRDPKFWPPALMFRRVKAGLLGRKTGRGWYEYTPDGKKKS